MTQPHIILVALHEPSDLSKAVNEIGKLPFVSMVSVAPESTEQRIADLRARADLQEKLWRMLRNEAF